MSARYRVTLTQEERKELESMTRQGKTHARKFIHARALLLCDAGADGPVEREHGAKSHILRSKRTPGTPVDEKTIDEFKTAVDVAIAGVGD